MRTLKTHKRAWIILGVLLAFIFTSAESCDGGNPPPASSESRIQQDEYRISTKAEPQHRCNGQCPTRKTINAWVDTWKQPGALAYVYLQNSDGAIINYFVTEGPPVSMCVGLTPPYVYTDIPGDGSSVKEQAPAPGVDGAYYGGCDNATKYAVDATTHALIQYTIGQGQQEYVTSAPLPGSIVGDAKRIVAPAPVK
jgi:hypothetical protein